MKVLIEVQINFINLHSKNYLNESRHIFTFIPTDFEMVVLHQN